MFCKSACECPALADTDSTEISVPCPDSEMEMLPARENADIDGPNGEVMSERFEMGDGRFIELLANNRLVVGASDGAEADRLVAEWQRQRKFRKEEAALEDEAARLCAAKQAEELALQKHGAQLAEHRVKEQQRRQVEAERAEQEEERLRTEEQMLQQEKDRLLELMAREETMMQEKAKRLAIVAAQEEEQRRKTAVDAFLKERNFHAVNEPRSAGWSVCKAPTLFPLHVAAESGDLQMVDMLLKEGADACLQTSVGKTALDVAQDRDHDGSHAAVVKLLGGEPLEPRLTKVQGAAPKPRMGGA